MWTLYVPSAGAVNLRYESFPKWSVFSATRIPSGPMISSRESSGEPIRAALASQT